MQRLVVKLVNLEQQLFKWINGRLHNRFLNFWLYYLTHLGGSDLYNHLYTACMAARSASMEGIRYEGGHRAWSQPHPCSHRQKAVPADSSVPGTARYEYVP